MHTNTTNTGAGNRNVRDVLAAVFAYIALIKGHGGVSQHIFEENRQLARLRFDFRDKPQPMQLAEALACSMQTHEDRCAASTPSSTGNSWAKPAACMATIGQAAD